MTSVFDSSRSQSRLPATFSAASVEPYSIKRGTTDLLNCDAEPVHTPGCIQSHGVLLVLRRADLVVLQVSENSADHLGKRPDEILGRSVAGVVGAEQAALLDHFIASKRIEKSPLYAFTLFNESATRDPRDASDATTAGPRGPLDALVQTIDGVVILELESTSRSLGEPDYFAAVKSTVARLQTVMSLVNFYQIVVDELRDLTGMDRVMVYRFHEDHSGEVVSEAKRADLAPYLGLRYPEGDIPRPARAIFEKIWIRPVPHAGAPLSEMVPLANPDTGRALEMTYCALRGASVMYTDYLANMGVGASLTLAIRREGKLWGLIACHQCTPFPMPHQVRSSCEFLAQIVSLQLTAVEQREHLEYQLQIGETARRLVDRAAQQGGLTTLVKEGPSLLDMVRCDGAAVFHGGQWWTVGRTPTEPQLDTLAAWLRSRLRVERAPYVYAVDHLARDYPEGEALAETASGLLAVSLAREGRPFVVWFRGETLRTVSWAGDPNEKPVVHGPHGPRLTPRKSFELWKEQVRGTSDPWKMIEIDTAAHLQISLMEIVVNRAEDLAALNADLSRSNAELATFAYVASHDLKEPLRGIHKYTSHLVEHLADRIDDDAKRWLNGLHHLTVRMDGFLDALLLFSRIGRDDVAHEPVALDQIVVEALEMASARREEMRADVRIPRPLPTVSGNPTQVRQILTNLIGNAFKYNDKPERWVEIGWLDPELEQPITFYVRDNGIGIKRRYLESIFGMFKRLHGRDEFGGGSGAGLTIVKKLVEGHGGRIWVDSVPGEGSTFLFTLAPEGEP